jgi:uncharacterized membrane protein HdeD (DUF308 family)
MHRSDTSGELAVFLAILFCAIGVFSIVTPHYSAAFFTHYVGWLILFLGGMQALMCLMRQEGWRLVWLLSLATLNIFLGVLIIENPYTDMIALSLAISIIIFSEGVVKLMLAFSVADGAWSWSVISGFASILVASLIWSGLPTESLWVLGLLIGLNLPASGMMILFIFSPFSDRLLPDMVSEPILEAVSDSVPDPVGDRQTDAS